MQNLFSSLFKLNLNLGVGIILLSLLNYSIINAQCDGAYAAVIIDDEVNSIYYPNVTHELDFQDPCSMHRICVLYENLTEEEKYVTITLQLPKALKVNLHGFELIDDSQSLDLYSKTVFIDAIDPEVFENPTIQECLDYYPHPTTGLGVNYSSGIFLAKISTDCTQEQDIFFSNYFMGLPNKRLIKNPEEDYVLLSDLISDNTFSSNCQSGLNPFYLDTELVVDTDYCFNGGSPLITKIVMTNPNAGITIYPDVKLSIDKIGIESCFDEAWDQIRLMPESSLTLNDCIIKDARAAVYIDTNSEVDPTGLIVSNTEFTDNYISIYAQDDDPNLSSNVNAIISGSFFIGNDVLKPLNNPIPPHLINNGIHLTGIHRPILVSGTTHPTLFKNLNVGINAINSSVNLGNASFANFIYDGRKTGIVIQGNGSRLTTLPFTSATFENMSEAIVAFGSLLYLRNIETKDVKTGIFSGLNRSWNMVDIEDCNIESDLSGIRLVASRPYRGHIANNNIDMLGNTTLQNMSGAIIASNGSTSGQQSRPYTIKNNTIELYDVEQGLGIFNSENFELKFNDVTFHDMGNIGYGVRLAGGQLHQVGCNDLVVSSSFSSSTFSAGVFGEQSGNAIISCNSIQNFAFGSRFIQANSMTDFKGNYLDNSNSTALHVDNGAVIGMQSYKGNLFPSQNDEFVFEAINMNSTTPRVQASRFTVNAAQNDDFYPNWYALAGSSSEWFRDLPHGTNYTCATSGPEYEDCAIPELRGDSVRLQLMTMSTETLSPGDTVGETRQYLLIRQLLKDFELHTPVSFEGYATWLSIVDKTDAYKVHLWETAFHHAFEPTSIEIDSLSTIHHSYLEVLADYYLNLDDSIAHEDNLIVIDSFSQIIDNINTSYQSYFNAMASRGVSTLDSLLLNMPQVQDDAAVVELDLMGDELALTLVELPLPDGLQLSKVRLTEVAQLCPDIFGQGVYRARGLLSLLTDENVYDDILCRSSVTPRRAPDSSESVHSETRVSIFPNPANGLINIQWDGEHTYYTVKMTSLQGKPILTQSVQEGTDFIQINVATLVPGVYIVQLFNADGQSIVQKVTIQ